MATKLENYVQMAANTAAEITKNTGNWKGFLNTAANLYRYTFPDQLLIHAQRPNNVKACASFDVWTKRMKFYVRRGAKGIALVDVQNGRPSLRYVFDIADTGRKKDSHNLYLWQYKEEYQETVTNALEKYFGIACSDGFVVQLCHIATRLAKDFWKNHSQDIICEVEGSSLDGLDEKGLRNRFCKAEALGITYILLLRCGFNPDNYLSPDVFQNISDFNTIRIIKVLGHAVSEASGDVLHQIAIAIFSYEREKKASQNNNKIAQTDNSTKPKTESRKKPSSFIISVEKDQTTQPSIKDIYEKYKPIVKDFLIKDKKYKNACRNSDKENAVLEGIAAIKRAALSIKDLEFMKLFYDLSEFHNRMQQEVLDETYLDLSATTKPEQNTSELRQEEADPTESEQAASESETIAEEPEQIAVKNLEPTAEEPEQKESAHAKPKPDTKSVPKPDYKVGDTVYLEDTLYEITEIRLFDVQLRDPSQAYPIFRVESKERFEDMLQRDKRNIMKTAPDHHEEPRVHPVTVLDESEVEVLPLANAASNYRITDDHLGEGSEKDKYTFNLYAIVMLKQIESENRAATPEEQEILAHYVGWGGIPQVFDENKADWSKEYKELQSYLTTDEYRAVKASTLNSHYTSPVIIKAIYAVISNMGFKSGNILEPSCGIGNFFGCLPETMCKSRLYGVELDSITGRIAKLLYPKAKISICGFEKTDFQKNFFDIAIGNVPFGQYRVNDQAYNKLKFSLHNYFFAKSIDQVRPGGILAFVTSRYTMDSRDTAARKYLAEKSDLLGAIRLPRNAFKSNAGTDVVSDIIFLQKRDTPAIEIPAWVHTKENADGFKINSYFLDNPDMVLGIPSSRSTQYGRMDYTVLPIKGADLAEQLRKAVSHIHGQYQEDLSKEPDKSTEETTLPADPDVKNFSFTLVGGKVYYRENSIMIKQELNASAKSRVVGMIVLRDCVHQLIDLQMDVCVSESEIKAKQEALNCLYDAYTHKNGLINDRANRQAFDKDQSYYLLCSLEILDDEGNLQRKADMFTKRTIQPHKTVTHVDTASEALTISIGERARVDLPFMAKITDKPEETLIKDLRGIIYKDPINNEWQTADEYLSGNVRRKLRQAKNAAGKNPDFQINVEALEKAQPKDLEASEIEVRIGATWIDKSYVQQFMYEIFNTPANLRKKIIVNYSPATAEWFISNKTSVPYNNKANMAYGTDRISAYHILEDSLNLRDVRIFDTVKEDGKTKSVLNARETTLAAQKQQALRDTFKSWIFNEPERRRMLVKTYNELMNSTSPREYDGSHIIFPGMNPGIQLQPHQLNAIARVLYGGNTLLAHEVGAGKTFEMIASAMEAKRLGLCHKAIFVVPNHLTEQTASEFLRLYPAANILVTTKKDFETSRRKKFCARIATSDVDAVIIGHSQFEKIPVSHERQKRLIERQIDEITEEIQEVESNDGERFTVKKLEQTKKGLYARLEKLQANYKKDSVVTFEQLGVDMMLVDESDNYKNLFLYTKMRNVAGLSTTDAQKSSDMFLKCRYLDEVTGGRGIVFATGTPISNSMSEMYTVMRYLQFGRLQELGMNHFDCWASRFGETVTAMELAPEGTGYRARTRFSRFFNLPELMQLFREVADIKTADQLNLPTPEVEYHNIVAKPTKIQEEMMQELSKRAEKVHRGLDARIDNMLKISSDGRKLGLDQRIINPMLPDELGTKVNLCVENILRLWREGDKDRLTQVVFCDISTPSGKPADTRQDVDSAFRNIYDDIYRKLVAGGMKPEQVAFIHSANTDIQKKELFAKVNSGLVRVLIGSTQKMGAGTNIQERLFALHNLDCPWRPRDLIQREGRICRRGNTNSRVHIFRYVTENTFDAYLWQTIENKQKFISQIMTSKSPARSCQDVDETVLSFAEVKALCMGDPRIKERMDLDLDVTRLKIMQSDYQSKKYRFEDSLLKYPKEIQEQEEYIAGLQADSQILSQHPHPEGGFAGMEINEVPYTDRVTAGTALMDACQSMAEAGAGSVRIGSYRGFRIFAMFAGSMYTLTMKGASNIKYQLNIGADARGNIARIDNALGKIETMLINGEMKLSDLIQQQKVAQEEVGKPFLYEDELRQKSAKLAALDAELNIGAPDPGHTAA